MGAERAALLPLRIQAGFDLLGVVGFVEHLLPYLTMLSVAVHHRSERAGLVGLSVRGSPRLSTDSQREGLPKRLPK
jgi:hypothetical protein